LTQPKETKGELVRYFFHVSGSSTYNDAIGQTFPNAEAAKAHAAKIANELAEDGSLNGHKIIVVDEQGHEILLLPIA
jgi:hypothetical protein